MSGSENKSSRPRRADALRSERALLDAATAVFARSGVDAPVREVAARAGVGMGTLYRHYRTRADLIVAVYRHQIDACAEAGSAVLEQHSSPLAALAGWVEMFVEFVATKHGLAAALGNGHADIEALHTEFIDRLVPVCAELLAACDVAGQLTTRLSAYELMRAIGNLCIHAGEDPRYDPRRPVRMLIAGMSAPTANDDASGGTA